MKFTVSKEALLDGLQRTQNVVSSRVTLPVLVNVLIEASDSGLRLTTTDMEVATRCVVDAMVEKPGATTIPAKRLALVVRELPSADILVDTDSKNVTSLSCGNSFFKIYGLPKEDFPPYPRFDEAKAITLKQAELKGGLRKTIYAVSSDETRYVLNGILFSFKDNKLTMVATDGRRLALFDTDLEFPKSLERDMIVPTKAVNELMRLVGEDGDLTIHFGEHLVLFRMGNTELVTKLVEGNYPNYRLVIPTEAKQRVTLEREAFLTSLRRVALFSAEKSSSVKLTFSKNNLDITANTPEVGEARESLYLQYEGRDFSIAFNPEFLIDPLRNLTEDEVYLELTEETSPGVLKINKPFLYVLMPMKVSA